MPKKTQSYRAWQMEKLANPERAASYLNAALQDSTESFLIALGKVAQANRISGLATEAEAATLDALASVLKAAGLRIEIGKDQAASEFPTPLFPVDLALQEQVSSGSGAGR